MGRAGTGLVSRPVGVTLRTGTFAAGIALAAAAAWAGPATDQVKGSVERVLQLVQDPELRKAENTEKRRARIREAARQIFDFDAMARRTLARHWQARSPEERQRFTELFADLLETSYVSKIEAYGGERILYLPEQVDGDIVIVRSKLVTQRGVEVPLEYRMQQGGERFKAFDVAIEGVSLVANYRTQFHKIITQSSFPELVRKLEQKQLEVAEDQRTRTKTR